jgi:kinesin family protein 20
VSNSGKTYTISGGQADGQDERGLLPRSIDVVFNSIQGMQSKANVGCSILAWLHELISGGQLRCIGMADIEFVEDGRDELSVFDGTTGREGESSTTECESVLRYLGEAEQCTAVVIDRNYSYAIFVSYAEVYNEKVMHSNLLPIVAHPCKIFDLLDAVLPQPNNPAPTPNGKHRPAIGLSRASSHYPLSGAFYSTMSLAAMANGGGGILKRRALALKNDPEGNGKYISGLNEVRVRSREVSWCL